MPKKKDMENISLPDKASFYSDIKAEYSEKKTNFKNTVDTITTFIDHLIRKLEEKKIQPFSRQSMNTNIPDIGNVVSSVNEVIRRHNNTSANFATETKKIGRKLASSMIVENMNDYKRLLESRKKAQDGADSLKTQVAKLTGDMDALNSKVRNCLRPAEELNTELKQYLGHGELRFILKDTGYTIMRGKIPAKSLSEGETTAIALLYFLKSLSDNNFERDKGIVVLDDPVSSLDSNAIYLAFGYIKEWTKQVGQLFVFTHNFTFFREIKNWFHFENEYAKKSSAVKPANFYMIDRADERVDPRQTVLRKLDPMLRKYETEYHYMFSMVYRAAHRSRCMPYDQVYLLANCARRLLDRFFAFRLPQSTANLRGKMRKIEFDEAKKTRIIRFVNTYSHGDIDSESEHDISILSEAVSVLRDIIDLIKSEDSKHYQCMVEATSD